MTLRLTDDETDALRAFAERHDCSMQDIVVREAIHQFIGDRPRRLREAIARVTHEDAELLDRLSR